MSMSSSVIGANLHTDMNPKTTQSTSVTLIQEREKLKNKTEVEFTFVKYFEEPKVVG